MAATPTSEYLTDRHEKWLSNHIAAFSLTVIREDSEYYETEYLRHLLVDGLNSISQTELIGHLLAWLFKERPPCPHLHHASVQVRVRVDVG